MLLISSFLTPIDGTSTPGRDPSRIRDRPWVGGDDPGVLFARSI